MQLFKVADLHLTLGGKTILKDVSFQLGKGKIIGLIGPNGAGKSSLIKVLAGLVFPERGTIYLKNNDITTFNELRNHSGYLIDGPALYPFLDATENLKLFCKLNKKHLKVENLLSMVGLAGTGKKKVKYFSAGMKQRLSIAQSLISDPEVLILDEPFNGLDPNGTKELTDLLKSINKEGKTILISSHLLRDLENLSDEFIVIHGGEVVLQISKEALQMTDKKIVFTFEDKLGKEARYYLKDLHAEILDDGKVVLVLSPDKIAAVVTKLVGFGAVPVNLETLTVLQEIYLEITK
jgi:ABC-2 type transport system ATP-binding protein